MNDLTREEVSQLRKDYLDGMSVRALAERENLPYYGLYNILRNASVKFYDPEYSKELSKEKQSIMGSLEKIYEMKSKGMSLNSIAQKIAEETNTLFSISTIQKKLKGNKE